MTNTETLQNLLELQLHIDRGQKRIDLLKERIVRYGTFQGDYSLVIDEHEHDIETIKSSLNDLYRRYNSQVSQLHPYGYFKLLETKETIAQITKPTL